MVFLQLDKGLVQKKKYKNQFYSDMTEIKFNYV